MRNILFPFLLLIIVFSCNTSPSNQSTTIQDSTLVKKVFFINLQEGDTVSSPLNIKMGVQGMQVEAAGVARIDYGHHHILLNRDSWTVNEVILKSDTIFHYPKGETEASIELKPGKQKLTLQFSDGIHQSYGKEISSTINIIVI